MPKRVTIPADHKPGLAVPKGGSSCSTCVFYSRKGGRYGSCSSDDFYRYYETSLIPCPPDEFCSDWYVPLEGLVRRRC